LEHPRLPADHPIYGLERRQRLGTTCLTVDLRVVYDAGLQHHTPHRDATVDEQDTVLLRRTEQLQQVWEWNVLQASAHTRPRGSRAVEATYASPVNRCRRTRWRRSLVVLRV